MTVRPPLDSEVDELATIWHRGWQDAHAAILPPELARHRTLESFRERLRDGISDVRVAGSPGHPLGFCFTKDAEIYQLYVSSDARGTGVAAAFPLEVWRYEKRVRS
ncbi:MAG: hypothetical protein R3E97_16885 [Candidatus Eisenbacteria bacterium]